METGGVWQAETAPFFATNHVTPAVLQRHDSDTEVDQDLQDVIFSNFVADVL